MKKLLGLGLISILLIIGGVGMNSKEAFVAGLILLALLLIGVLIDGIRKFGKWVRKSGKEVAEVVKTHQKTEEEEEEKAHQSAVDKMAAREGMTNEQLHEHFDKSFQHLADYLHKQHQERSQFFQELVKSVAEKIVEKFQGAGKASLFYFISAVVLAIVLKVIPINLFDKSETNLGIVFIRPVNGAEAQIEWTSGELEDTWTLRSEKGATVIVTVILSSPPPTVD